MNAKTVIVGGGIMGATIAMHLAQRTDPLREPVVLVDKGPIGLGSSSRSGAILRMLYKDRMVAQMARDSLREYAGFEARTGRSIGFRRSGVITLASKADTDLSERLRSMHALLREMGAEVELVEGRAIRDLVRDIRVTDDTIGVWEPHGATINAVRTTEAFTALARTYGAVTRVRTSVREILVEDGKFAGVVTDEGTIRATQLVVAAGPWSGHVLEPIGVELPLRVVRPEIVFFQMAHVHVKSEDALERTHLGPGPNLDFDMSEGDDEVGELGLGELTADLHPVVIDLELGFFARCEPSRGRTRVGRTYYGDDQVVDHPDRLEEVVASETVAWARDALARRLPEYGDLEDAGVEAAMYTLTPDSQALIGAVPAVEGVYVATGFSGHGFKLAPSVGLGMAQMLSGERVTAFDAEFFAPGRFQGALTWSGQFGI